MAGKHRSARPGRRPVELVDARSLKAHLLTQDAYEAGFDPKVGYVALCETEVLPACLAEPGQGYCRSCHSIPTQRSTRRTTLLRRLLERGRRDGSR